MRKYRINISAGGVLLLAALYFFMDTRDFIALMLAAARMSVVTSPRSGRRAAVYAASRLTPEEL